MFENSKVIIAYSNHQAVRHRATSGGIGSSIVQYLFREGLLGTAVSFKFNPDTLHYEPCLVFCEQDYQVTGSIYHEINLVHFINEHVSDIKGRFICFALPCQVKGIKAILKRHHIDNIVIELTCSSQQSFEATEYLMKRLNLAPSEVKNIRYRGDGWPGGVRLETKKGKVYHVKNNFSVWMDIFHSKLFCMPRCFQCNMQNIDTPSDMVVADPWRIDTEEKEKEGRTLCWVKSKEMELVLQKMYEQGEFHYEERSDSDLFFSQEGTILRKNSYLRHKRLVKIMKKLCTDGFYRNCVLNSSFLFKLHLILLRIIHKLIR